MEKVQKVGGTSDARPTGEMLHRSPTEVARIVAAERGWSFVEGGALIDREGVSVAPSIEDASRAMISLGCIHARSGVAVDWGAIQPNEAEGDVRAVLGIGAKPDRLPGGAPAELVGLLDLTDAELKMLARDVRIRSIVHSDLTEEGLI